MDWPTMVYEVTIKTLVYVAAPPDDAHLREILAEGLAEKLRDPAGITDLAEDIAGSECIGHVKE